MNGYGLSSGAKRMCGKRAPMRHHSDRRDTVRRFKKRADEAGHVKNLKRPGKDCESLGMY